LAHFKPESITQFLKSVTSFTHDIKMEAIPVSRNGFSRFAVYCSLPTLAYNKQPVNNLQHFCAAKQI